VDNIDGIVIQIAGTKRFFLSSEREIEEAVNGGRLPESVLTYGKTDNFLKEGTIDSVFGLNEKSPKLCGGEIATLAPGDCLLLPSGLYHDVQTDCERPSVSLTIRFRFPSSS
jgi:ribosomal protein L16 Arg81 hydroxylase